MPFGCLPVLIGAVVIAHKHTHRIIRGVSHSAGFTGGRTIISAFRDWNPVLCSASGSRDDDEDASDNDAKIVAVVFQRCIAQRRDDGGSGGAELDRPTK